jgi:CubicO group peptidase (beta-lactamase class C family)
MARNVRFLVIAALIVAYVSQAPAVGQAGDAGLAAKVDSLLNAATRDGFGGAVMIDREGRILLSKGFGLANRDARIPFTVDTIAPMGSITKSFTALALVQLAAQGNVDLQRTLKAYLPSAVEPGASVRISDVLAHQAGFAEYCGGDWVRRTKADLIAECTAKPLVAQPGTVSYSNPGYSLLAAVVEEVSGQTWEDYLRDHVFVPADMTRSGWIFQSRSAADFAVGYLNNRSEGVEADRIAQFRGEVWNLKGNGGLQASAKDMHRFYTFLLRQPASIREPMTTPHTAEYSQGVREGYGFAFRIDRRDKPYRMGSSGSDGVFLSYFMWLPQQNTFMYLVGNNGEERVRAVLRAVVTAVQEAVGARP